MHPAPELPHQPRLIELPAGAVLMLVGASASGKSTWVRRFFAATEIVSSDRCRALVADAEADQSVNRHAFAVFYEIILRRLIVGRTTVADSTGLSAFARARLRAVAARGRAPVHVVVICAPLATLLANNAARPRRVPEPVLVRHVRELQILIEEDVLATEGYAAVHYLRAAELDLTAPRVVAADLPVPIAGA